MMRSGPAALLLGTLLCLLPGAAGASQPAQNQPEPPTERPDLPAQPVVPAEGSEPTPPAPLELFEPRPIRFQFQARGELGMNSDLRDEPGDVTVSRLGATFAAAIPVRQYAQLDVGLDYEFSHYAFSDTETIAPGLDGPWEQVHRETLSVRFSQQLTRRASAYVGGTFGFSHEEGASLGESVTVSGFAGGRFTVAEYLTIGMGLAVRSRFEEGPQLIPLPGFDWQITDRLRLTTGGRLGAAFEYTASEDVKFSLGGAYQLREFRLRESGPVPGGVGRDRRVPIAGAVTYTPTPQLSIELSGGGYLAQNYRILDDGGQTRFDFDAKPTPFGGLQINYRF